MRRGELVRSGCIEEEWLAGGLGIAPPSQLYGVCLCVSAVYLYI